MHAVYSAGHTAEDRKRKSSTDWRQRRCWQCTSLRLWMESEQQVVLARKKDSSLLICIDYGKLTGVKARDTYLMRKGERCIDTLSIATYFRVWMYIGYSQMQLINGYRDKAPSKLQHGDSMLMKRLFSLLNMLGTFQSHVDVISSRVKL